MSGRAAAAGFPLVLSALQAKQVARRAKTQLRRTTSTVLLADDRRVVRACGLEAGHTYRVQAGPDGEVVANILVATVTLQRLGDLTATDALAEGHESVPAFADWWLRRHDHSWPPQQEKLCSNCHGHAEYTDHAGSVVACVLCELGVVMVDEPQTPAQITGRFSAHHDRQLWVVAFDLDDRRFMHRHSQRGYTSDPAEAMFGEPEVIGAPTSRWRTQSSSVHRAQAAAADDARLSGLPTIDDHLEQLRVLAAERGVDLTRERHVVEARRAAAARKLNLP